MHRFLARSALPCRRPQAVATFWAAALVWPVTDMHHDIAVVASDLARMPRLLFLAVPEGMRAGVTTEKQQAKAVLSSIV